METCYYDGKFIPVDEYDQKEFDWDKMDGPLSPDQVEAYLELSKKCNKHSDDEIKRRDEEICAEGTRIAKEIGLI